MKKARIDLRNAHMELGEARFPDDLPTLRLFDNDPYSGFSSGGGHGRRLFELAAPSNSLALVMYTRNRNDWMSSHFVQTPLFLCTMIEEFFLCSKSWGQTA